MRRRHLHKPPNAATTNTAVPGSGVDELARNWLNCPESEVNVTSEGSVNENVAVASKPVALELVYMAVV